MESGMGLKSSNGAASAPRSTARIEQELMPSDALRDDGKLTRSTRLRGGSAVARAFRAKPERL
jgi:hypothetical protein